MDEREYCPTVDATQMLTKRWTVLLIKKLLDGPQRFSEMEGSLLISGRILSERLRELEMEELIKRHVYPDIPVRVEYVLTDKGRALKPIIQEIEIWARAWVKQRPERIQELCLEVLSEEGSCKE
jgi:DNA-binding HxlR family transcriptional regulator